MKQAISAPSFWRKPSFQRNETAPQKKSKIAALDGVRAIAALLVVTLHINTIAGLPWNANANPIATAFAVFGRNGVVLFFVLSGFLLFMPYAKALLFQEEWPSIRKFYLRRIFRIWPGYYLTLFLMILLFEQKYLQPAYWKRLGLFLTFFMDSSQETWQQINGPFWTLATEWQFYLVLPILALAFAWIVRRFASTPYQRLKMILFCCAGVIIWGLLIRGFGLNYQRHPDWDIPLPHPVLNIFLFFAFGIQGKYLEVFSLGMIASTLYMFTQHPEYGQQLKNRLHNWSNRLWIFGWLVIIFIALWHAEATQDRNATPDFTALSIFHPLRSFFAWVGEPIVGFGFGLCILAILFGSVQLRWLFETRLLRWLGMLSFAIYMWHHKLILYLHSYLLLLWPQINNLQEILAFWTFFILFILPLCYLIYKLIEEPGIRLGQRITSRNFASWGLRNLKLSLSPRALLARLHRS
ncbi:MAG TPA: acyltransferase [Ktedonobacteraceae bacterium]|nr:acyltransferase [Ktedonobacteraceae bacterium]